MTHLDILQALTIAFQYEPCTCMPYSTFTQVTKLLSSSCCYLSSVGNAFPGETLAGASERHLQALISKKKRSGPHAQPGLNTAFRAVHDAVVRRCRVHMMLLHMSSTPSHLKSAPAVVFLISSFNV